MFRTTMISVFLAGLLASGATQAQRQDSDRAPEGLGQLPISEQVRTIEDEYRQQSHGKRIPDNQLDFYLDQIGESHWGFSKIQNDIARSLGNGNGNTSGWRPAGSWKPREVICTSINRQYKECRAPFDGPARLSQQMSDASCVENSNWGSRPGILWVDAGCRGRFVEDHPSWPNWGHRHGQKKILCESQDSRYQQCNADFRGPALLSQQVSKSSCEQGRSWGQGPGMIWVSRGCRAWFEDTGWNNGGIPGASNYHISCASTDSHFRTCSWNDRYGLPRLIEQTSNARCEEGRSWGYRNGSVWVDNGCRARFGPR